MQQTGREKERNEEDKDYVPVIIKRTDEALRHPDDILGKAIKDGIEQLDRLSVPLALSHGCGAYPWFYCHVGGHRRESDAAFGSDLLCPPGDRTGLSSRFCAVHHERHPTFYRTYGNSCVSGARPQKQCEKNGTIMIDCSCRQSPWSDGLLRISSSGRGCYQCQTRIYPNR